MYQYLPFIGCIGNDMKSLAMDFTNKKMEGLHGRNVFNVGIDATKVVKAVRLSQHNNFIVKGVHEANTRIVTPPCWVMQLSS